MVSTAGGIIIAIVVLALAGAVGWVVFTQLRARRLGLPPPTLSSYFPWKKDDPYGVPNPAPGGVVGWFNDQVRKFKNRNNRSAAGAYEQTGGGGARGDRRGFGPLDPDEAWDARVGNEADQHGYFEEEERLGGGHGGRSTEYGGGGGGGGGYNMNLAATPRADGFEDDHRGRGQSVAAARNPFDDDAEGSLRGVSPRPIDTQTPAAGGHKGKRAGEPDSAGDSPTERRSVFRENV